jgi:NAD dependent epimerase/dehydratase family enzyme
MAGIIQFFEGQNIFVTGATGFMGKVLLEKLLRACPDLGNIFVLIRPNKGKDPSERVQNMISLPVINNGKCISQGAIMLCCGNFMRSSIASYQKESNEHYTYNI